MFKFNHSNNMFFSDAIKEEIDDKVQNYVKSSLRYSGMEMTCEIGADCSDSEGPNPHEGCK